MSNLTFSTKSCQCVNDAAKNTTNCDCCVAKNIWVSAVPICNSTQALEKCVCKNNNFNTTAYRNVTVAVNQTSSVTCFRSGCSGEICGTSVQRSSCKWNNTYACYAQASCEYSAVTRQCTWTSSANLTACLAKPAVIATTDLSKYQNLTSRPNTTYNLTTIVNTTQVQAYNITKTVESCSCASSRFPNLNMSTPPVSSSICGQDATNSSQYQCCVSRDYVEGLYFGRQSCSAGLDTADCACNSSRNATCQCTPVGSMITYRNLLIDTSRCQCLNSTNVSKPGQQCRCCIGQMSTLMPRPTTCNATTSSSQVCDCAESFNDATNRSVLKCQCKQSTTTQ